MVRKPYKANKKGAGQFVQLPEWLQKTEAWRTLKPGPRALYVELKRRYSGKNNGRIILSHRDAAKALNVHRNTVGPWFDELAERGFIRMTQAPHLGPSGVGLASIWALDEMPTDDMKPARKTFTRWSEKTKAPHKKQDTPSQKTGHLPLENAETRQNRPKNCDALSR